MSTTVTSCVAVAVFPFPSITVHVTVVFPIGNDAGALLLIPATVQLSDEYGLPRDTDAFGTLHTAVAAIVRFPGATIIGSAWSKTVIV